MPRRMVDMLAEAADDSIRVIVLAGSGGSFSAGLDRPGETRSGLDRQRSEFPVESLARSTCSSPDAALTRARPRGSGLLDRVVRDADVHAATTELAGVIALPRTRVWTMIAGPV